MRVSAVELVAGVPAICPACVAVALLGAPSWIAAAAIVLSHTCILASSREVIFRETFYTSATTRFG